MTDTTKIIPGVYTVGELLNLANVDFLTHATTDYGVDYRRVQIGGLPFDNLDKVVIVSDDEATTTLEIRADGKKVGSLTVDHNGEYRHRSEVVDTAEFPS